MIKEENNNGSVETPLYKEYPTSREEIGCVAMPEAFVRAGEKLMVERYEKNKVVEICKKDTILQRIWNYWRS